MDIDQMTVGDVKRLAAMFGSGAAEPSPMLGKYVIVRCKDAGVHAGVLVSSSGRGCVLSESRRLWYWKPANGAAFLSGVAANGLHDDSKVGVPVEIELTENCEIIACTSEAEASIRALKSYEA